MKKIFGYFLLVVAMMACSVETSAQDNAQNNAQNNGRQRMTREELAEKQARHIADVIAMDDAAASRFVKLYGECQKEIWALGPKVGKKSRGKGSANMTDAEVEQDLKGRFEHSQKILDIRQKYYKEYSKFLSQKQIKRVYEIEKQMKTRLARHKAQGRRPRQGMKASR